MTNVWLTSDTHFNHSNIILYEKRPFKDKDEMNEYLIQEWNKVVKPEDVIYHLGDVVFGGSKVCEGILPRLNGYKILRAGNHDFHGSTLKRLKKYFDEVYTDDILLDGMFCLSHYPLEKEEMDKLLHIDLIKGNVCGHVHSQHHHLDPKKYLCVSVENTNYRPIHLDEVRYHFGIE